MIFAPVQRFKSLARERQVPAELGLRKDFVSIVEDIDDRKVRFTISTGTIDRDGDTVAVDGWQLDAFRANPVVLWGHDARNLPIGRCVEIGSDGAALKALVEFVPADMPERGMFAEAVLRMCRTGFLSATSVGFRPLAFELAKDRMDDDDWFPPLDFTSQELMEFSVVSIPCNPEALIDGGERRGLVTPPPAPATQLLDANATEKDAAEVARIATVTRMRAQRRRLASLVALA